MKAAGVEQTLSPPPPGMSEQPPINNNNNHVFSCRRRRIVGGRVGVGVEKHLTEEFQRLFANTSGLEGRREGFLCT